MTCGPPFIPTGASRGPTYFEPPVILHPIESLAGTYIHTNHWWAKGLSINLGHTAILKCPLYEKSGKDDPDFIVSLLERCQQWQKLKTLLIKNYHGPIATILLLALKLKNCQTIHKKGYTLTLSFYYVTIDSISTL